MIKRVVLILLAVAAVYLGCAFPVSAHITLAGEVPCGSAVRAVTLEPIDPASETDTQRQFIAICDAHGKRSILAGAGAAVVLVALAVALPGRGRKRVPTPFVPATWAAAGSPPPPPLPLSDGNPVPGPRERDGHRAPGAHGGPH